MSSLESRLIGLMAKAIPLMVARASAGLSIADEASVLALSGEPCADLNMLVIGACRDARQRLEEASLLVARRNLPLLGLFVPDIDERLASRALELGFARAGQVPLMHLPEDADVETRGECDVEHVADEQSARMASELQARGFGLPGDSMWRLLESSFAQSDAPSTFVASRDSIPMSTVTVTAHGETAGIWSMATPPEHQRKGIGRALLTRVISKNRARGARDFYLVATEAGRPLYGSIGFRSVANLSAWVLGDSVQVHK